MHSPELARQIQHILEVADLGTIRSYAYGWLETIANESPAMFAEECEKYFIEETEESHHA